MHSADAERLVEAVRFVQQQGVPSPHIGVVLGSGLGAFAESLSELTKIPYAQIPNMPRSNVIGHPGNLCLGKIGTRRVACLQGRVHAYEGYDMSSLVFGVRLLHELGVSTMILTNAAGGISSELTPGSLMVITDHLNLTGQNPLVGPNDARGMRFPDMTTAYDPELSTLALKAAAELAIDLKTGIYAAMLGPSYETPAEVRMLRILGADAVGMSTVYEVIALRQRGVRTAAISCITNFAAGISAHKLDHAEVEREARNSEQKFVSLLQRWVELIPEPKHHD